MTALRITFWTVLAATTLAAQGLMPLDQVRAGQIGVGKTVFQGDDPEEFDVEILGVLEDVGPKQSIILARLSGEKVERTGVMAGMSGSPVYVDGKLIGAVAFAFAFSKEPIAGIRPIADMLAPGGETAGERATRETTLAALRSGEAPLLPLDARAAPDEQTLIPIATPVSFGGFTARTLEVFGEQLERLGLRPLQGIGGRARRTASRPLTPGDMVSVALVRGDLNVNAAGTLTHIDGDRIYGFGHTFLNVGPADLPMMRSNVIATVPSLSNSFKLAGVGDVIGAIEFDRSTGVVGRLGAGPELTPLSISVQDHQGAQTDYRLELVRDPYLTPFLLQMSVFAAIDATERQLGPQTLRVEGRARFAGLPDLSLDELFSGAASVGQQASLGIASTLAFLTQTATDPVQPEQIELRFTAEPKDLRARIVRAWTNRERVRPGEDVELSAVVRAPDGQELLRRTTWRVPPTLTPGELFVTFSDASQLNFLQFPALMDASKLPAAGIVEMLNRLRASDGLYLRIWRQQAGIRVLSSKLQAAPASLRSVLSGPRGAAGGAADEPYVSLHETQLDRFDAVVEGEETFRITVVE